MYESAEYFAKVLNYYGLDHTQKKVVCPFHGDINPSMLINLNQANCYCFGCQKHYDAYELVKTASNLQDDFEIYKMMAKINKIDSEREFIIPEMQPEPDYEQLRLQAQNYYSTLPKTNWDEYTVENAEFKYLIERGYSPKLLNACGAKINYSSNYTIIFPIMDNREFKGWVCRTIDKETEKKRKYLYNKGFKRSSCLCGVYSNKNPLIITEGYFDMLKLRQQGFKNVVAILGWKISNEQIKKIKAAGIEKIISALDNDKAGNEGHDYLLSVLHKEIQRWKFRNWQKDVGEQSTKEIEKNLNYFLKNA